MDTDLTIANVDIAKKLGLSAEEYEKIVEILQRQPNFAELSVFSVMWSEHCSYKNSIKYLKTLPKEGPHILAEAGEENAGLVDIGDGLACAFKIESHNHPSAIEPYQGAATGVGGIHRDIFTMGARPIAALNSLRFGNLDSNRMKYLVKGVVKGIGDYGNCLGVPTVAGEVYFDDCYNQNILVNAMSVGIVKIGETVSAISEGVGNPVYIVGSATGKDGIHGATFASADLTEDSADDLPSVQVGDPFQEKLLLEASLEAIQTGAIVGMQDMGAAGICCSSSEMSEKGECGMLLNLDKVPTRQEDMKAFEILLSESQERMLIVCKKGREKDLEAVFEKWDLECAVIGEVTGNGRLEMHHKGHKVLDIPAESLVLGGGAPVYDREYEEPEYYRELQKFNLAEISLSEDWKEAATKVMKSPNLISRSWITQQYDSMVRTNTMHTNNPSDAGVIRLKQSDKALAVTTDCNSSYVYADPYIGAMIAVSEAARNIICSGGTPVAITNCLNFGNPYNPGVYWQFVNTIKGMGEACRKFNTPVTGGNVSFYNQSVLNDRVEPVNPTPTIGMLGLLPNYKAQMTLDFKSEGDLILLLGSPKEDLNQSVYLKEVLKIAKSPVPYFNLEEEFALHNCLKELIHKSAVASAHDISEGGLFACLIESAIPGKLGFKITTDKDIRKDAFLFGEYQGRAIVSIKPDALNIVNTICKNFSVEVNNIGIITNKQILIDDEDFDTVHYWSALHNKSFNKTLDN
jgi:phosphoribosylformylglycinamidine synthase